MIIKRFLWKHSVMNYFRNLNFKRTINIKHLKKNFVDTLNNQAPKKSKIFGGNQKLHIRNAIMKRSKLKIKQRKKKSVDDLINQKKQRNL